MAIELDSKLGGWLVTAAGALLLTVIYIYASLPGRVDQIENDIDRAQGDITNLRTRIDQRPTRQEVRDMMQPLRDRVLNVERAEMMRQYGSTTRPPVTTQPSVWHLKSNQLAYGDNDIRWNR